MNEDLERRLATIAARRGGHFLVRSSDSNEDSKAVADDLVHLLRLRPLGDAWGSVPADRAIATLAYLLHQWLAYPKRFMSATEARALAEEFVGTFGPDPVCLTNVEWLRGKPGAPSNPRGSAYSWQPITESTFDAGVVCLGAGLEGLFWFEEED